MGASSSFKWVRTDEIGNYDWSNGQIDLMQLPEMDGMEDFPNFDSIEGIVLVLARMAHAEFLLDTQADFVFTLTAENLDEMMDKCRSLIVESIQENAGMNWESGKCAKVFNYWDDDIPEDLCRALRLLGYAKETVERNKECSLVVELEW